jgi:hypothetical protein
MNGCSNQTSWLIDRLPKAIGRPMSATSMRSFVAATMCRAWSYSMKWQEAHLSHRHESQPN